MLARTSSHSATSSQSHKAACLDLGMSMGDQAALLFRSWVESHKTGGLGGSLDFGGRPLGTEALESEALPLIDEIHVAFEAQTKKLMGAIQPSAARFGASTVWRTQTM
jgi:hypothetical protein